MLRRFLSALSSRRAAPADDRRDLVPRDALSSWVIAEPRPGLRLWVDLGDYGVSRPCMANAYEPLETAFVESYLQPGMWFVDVGANIGWFSLLAARRVGPTGGVIAIEPRPDSAARLARSAEENDYSGIVVHQVAAGAAAGRMKVGALIAGHNTGGTWLLTTDSLLERTAVGHQLFDVDVVRLDDIAIGGCDLLKLDVEGAEHLVLAGAAVTIARWRPMILSEINPEVLRHVSRVSAASYIAQLRDMGYRPHELTATGAGPPIADNALAAIEAPTNVLFVPDDGQAGERRRTISARRPAA